MQRNQQTYFKYILLAVVSVGLIQELSFTFSKDPVVSKTTTQTQQQTIQNQQSEYEEKDVDDQNKYNSQKQDYTHKKYSSGDLDKLQINVQYCSSCSYGKSFEELKSHLSNRYPQLTINGGQYPLSPQIQLLSTVLQYAQYGIFGLGIFGDRVQAIATNPLYQRIRANKMMYLMGGYFMLNMLKSSLSSTGAFEVFFDGQLIFSKLQSGQMPTPLIIQNLIEQKIAFK